MEKGTAIIKNGKSCYELEKGSGEDSSLLSYVA
jgi:hypothetical protein